MRKLAVVLGGLILSSTALAEQPLSLSLAPNEPPEPVIVNDMVNGHLSYVAGYKKLGNGWGDAKDQIEVGAIDFDIQPRGSFVSIAGQALVSLGDGVDTLGSSSGSSRTTELNLGLRVIPDTGVLRPFAGGGISFINASADSRDGSGVEQSDDDWSVGAWVGGGLYWHVSPDWHIGVAAQYTWNEVTLFGKEENAGGLHIMLMAGVHW